MFYRVIICVPVNIVVSQMWVRQRGPAGRDFSTQDSIIGAVLLKYWNISELQSFIVQMFLLR